MLDYTLNDDEKREFILKYEIVGNKESGKQIKVYFASDEGKSDYYIPYSKENEEKLLKRMKQQVVDAKLRIEKLSTYNEETFRFVSIIAATFIGVFSILFPQLLVFELMVFAYMLHNNHKISKTKKLKADIKKNLLFLDHEIELNTKVRKNYNMTYDVSVKTQKRVEKTKMDRPVLTINTIHSMPIEDIEMILKNIKREEDFAFDYHVEEKEQPKVMQKKIQ